MHLLPLQFNVILKSVLRESGLCTLQYKITDLETSRVLINNSEPITSAHNTTVLISVANLKPFTKYKCDAAIVCGGNDSARSSCPPVTKTIPMYTFETAEGRPGKTIVIGTFSQALFATFQAQCVV